MTVPAHRGHGVSVVICTIGRTDGAFRAVRSVVQDDPDAELVVIDQSGNGELARLTSRETGLGGVRVIRAPARGLSAARNAGVRACSGWIVAFTDDDCEVRPGWINGLWAAFTRDIRIGMVFGTVEAAPHDRTAGFIPAYRVAAHVEARSLAHKARIEGIGASMAVRREAWSDLGGFDESLGSGTRFRAGEDADFAVRALRAGWRVVETPAPLVEHHGFRTWDQGRALIEGYMYGLGATNAKMMRLDPLRAVVPLAALAWRWLAGSPVVDLNHTPPRLSRLGPFLRGAWDSIRLPLSPRSGHFGGGPEVPIRDADSDSEALAG